ncbi:MAG: L-threonylcarbamoyladenylate synthase [Elusimicrobiota bacterium]
MKTTVIKINSDKPDIDKLKKAAEVLKNGGLVAIPTETVYGLAVSAFNADAQKKVYKLKGRSFNKPLILMASSAAQMDKLIELHDKAKKMAKKYWPGPLTLVCHTTYLGKLAMSGRHNCGVRIPADKVVAGLLELCPFPLATTSANPSSKPSAKSGKEALKYFDGKIDLLLDSGKCRIGKESTVVDATHFPFVVVREGCLPKKELLKYI